MQTKKELITQYKERFEEAPLHGTEPIPVEFLEVAIDIRDSLKIIADHIASWNEEGRLGVTGYIKTTQAD